MEKFLEARCMAENAQQGNGTPPSRTHPEHIPNTHASPQQKNRQQQATTGNKKIMD